MNFSSGKGGVQFSDIGMTSVQTGVTAAITTYQISTGATTPTYFTPMPLNYVVGADVNSQISGNSYQNFAGRVSLTTQASRVVQIQMKSTAAGGYLTFNGADNTSNVGYLRLVRGNSTFVDGSLFTFNTVQSGATFFTQRLAPTCFTFYDLTPISGAATYTLQAQTDGLSTQIGFNSAALFVRQL